MADATSAAVGNGFLTVAEIEEIDLSVPGAKHKLVMDSQPISQRRKELRAHSNDHKRELAQLDLLAAAIAAKLQSG